MTLRDRLPRRRTAPRGLFAALACASACHSAPPAEPPPTPAPPPATRASAVAAAMPPPKAGPWWENAVFYEIYPRSFQDTNNDGIGDLNGVTRRLDYLAALGVDAIWLTPFYPSPQVDFGYDISDYENVDPQFGTLADFDRLVAEAHRRKIKIITDLVLNHTSDKHPFFVSSRSSRTSPMRDFYVWRDPVKGKAPNNWASIFEPSGWTLDPATKQYYYHAFYAEQPDLNWSNPAVEKAMFASVKFWLDRGVDGFRLDAVSQLVEDPSMRDNPVLPTMRDGSPTEHDQEQTYTASQPGVHDILKRLRAFVDSSYGDRVLISESYVPPNELVRYYGANNDEIELPFNFSLIMQKPQKLDAAAFRASVDATERVLSGRPTTCVLSNHDQPRAYDRYGDGAHNDAIAKLMATMLLTLRGAPFVYYGEEIAMTTTDPARLEDVRDPVGRRYWPKNKGRDGERTPMQWSPAPNAGFTAPSAHPWLPVPAGAATKNVDTEGADPSSVYSYYRRVLDARRKLAALNHGDYRALGNDPNVYAYRRSAGSETVFVVLNMSPSPQTFVVDDPAAHAARFIAGTARREPMIPAGGVRLAPFEAAIYLGPTTPAR